MHSTSLTANAIANYGSAICTAERGDEIQPDVLRCVESTGTLTCYVIE